MSEAIERLTPEQELELAACYCEWCGVDEADRDEWRSEMVTAKRYVREWMAYWRKREKRYRKKAETIVQKCQRCEELETRVRESKLLFESILIETLTRSGMDLSPCKSCGQPVVCVPDGLACCKPCAEKMGGK